MKKKLLLGIILTVVITCLFAISVSAIEYDGVHYSIDTKNQTATVSADNKTATKENVVIPESFEYEGVTYKVTSIANDAFSGNDIVVSIRIESPHITKIPSSFILNTYDGALRSIYLDFTKITRIETAGLNAGGQSNGNSPKANEIYYYDLDGNKITKFDFPNIEYIGFAAFQGINFDEIVIHGNTQFGLSGEYSQCFRMSTAQTFILKGERTSIDNYQFESMPNLKKIVIESTSLEKIGSQVLSGCKLLEEIYIDLSGVTSIGGYAFRFSGEKGVTQNLAQWYNLDGEKIVDLSAVESLGMQSFNGSNLGSAKVLWPTNYTAANFGHSSDSGAFRSANLKGTVYFDAVDGTELFIDSWAFRGNSIETVILGPNVTKVAGCFNGQKTIKTVVFLADSVECTDSNLFKDCSGITFYHKTLTTNTKFSQTTQINISNGSYTTYGACGLVVDLTPVEGEKVTLNYVKHDYKEVADPDVCPAGSLMIYTCAGCKDSYTEELENYIGGTHVFDRNNGATVVDVIFGTESYFGEGVIVVKCAHCDAQANDEQKVGALFIADGYSIPENGTTDCISHTIRVNKSNIAQYEELTGNIVNYGITAGVNDSAQNPIKIEDGKAVANNYAVSADMTGTEYTKLVIKITGLEKGVGVSCNAYIVFNADPTKIYYLCDDKVTTEAVIKSL